MKSRYLQLSYGPPPAFAEATADEGVGPYPMKGAAPQFRLVL